MKEYVNPKEYWLKMTVDILEIKQAEIARDLKLSTGQISKLMRCEQKNPDFDNWIWKKITEKRIVDNEAKWIKKYE